MPPEFRSLLEEFEHLREHQGDVKSHHDIMQTTRSASTTTTNEEMKNSSLLLPGNASLTVAINPPTERTTKVNQPQLAEKSSSGNLKSPLTLSTRDYADRSCQTSEERQNSPSQRKSITKSEDSDLLSSPHSRQEKRIGQSLSFPRSSSPCKSKIAPSPLKSVALKKSAYLTKHQKDTSADLSTSSEAEAAHTLKSKVADKLAAKNNGCHSRASSMIHFEPHSLSSVGDDELHEAKPGGELAPQKKDSAVAKTVLSAKTTKRISSITSHNRTHSWSFHAEALNAAGDQGNLISPKTTSPLVSTMSADLGQKSLSARLMMDRDPNAVKRQSSCLGRSLIRGDHPRESETNDDAMGRSEEDEEGREAGEEEEEWEGKLVNFAPEPPKQKFASPIWRSLTPYRRLNQNRDEDHDDDDDEGEEEGGEEESCEEEEDEQTGAEEEGSEEEVSEDEGDEEEGGEEEGGEEAEEEVDYYRGKVDVKVDDKKKKDLPGPASDLVMNAFGEDANHDESEDEEDFEGDLYAFGNDEEMFEIRGEGKVAEDADCFEKIQELITPLDPEVYDNDDDDVEEEGEDREESDKEVNDVDDEEMPPDFFFSKTERICPSASRMGIGRSNTTPRGLL